MAAAPPATTTGPAPTPWRSVGVLAGLALSLPVDLAVTAAALLTTRAPRPVTAAEPRTVLISGGKMTKALQLARSFSAAGHRVVLVEKATYRFTGHRFSRAVDAFHLVPDPRDTGYAQALLDIVRAEGDPEAQRRRQLGEPVLVVQGPDHLGVQAEHLALPGQQVGRGGVELRGHG